MTKDVSLFNYFKGLFEDSLVTGIPQIIQTRSVSRKILKAIVLICCLIGFIYQTTEFLHIFWNYPTVLDIEVEYPEHIESPAITFCNLNGIKRNLFCEENPSNCSSPSDSNKFCEAFPHICGKESKENLKYPVREALTLEHDVSNKQRYWLKEMGHSNTVTLQYCMRIDEHPGIFRPCNSNVIHMQMDTGNDGYRNCYTLYSSLNSTKLNEYTIPVPKRKEPLFHMVFNPEPNEYFRPDREVGVIVAIHSPNSIINPFYDGFIVKPGHLHAVHLKVVEEKLLPFPYETKCQDYKSAWLQRGGKGPLSQEMCVAECVYNASLTLCSCILPSILLPLEHRICDHSELDCFNFNISECYNICQQSCEFTDFDYDIKERKLQAISAQTVEDFYTRNDEVSKYGVVVIFLKRPEKIIYSHRPQYEDIEVFSFMGGYVGMWLGVSLIAVFDFIESVILFLYFWLTRKAS